MGGVLTDLLIDTLVESPRLVERGIRHVEEMQLVSIGVGPDRISDIAANVLKRDLIEYTQKQAGLWNIELRANVPVGHYFDADVSEWRSGYFDLPVNPETGDPIILVPRRIVRNLPWINYGDFLRSEFVAVLKASPSGRVPKRTVVTVSRSEVERIDQYVRAKERAAAQALPSRMYLSDENECGETEALKRRLASIEPDRPQAADYQHLILEILNLLFNPDLIDGELEVRTTEGTDAAISSLRMTQTSHSGTLSEPSIPESS